MSRGRALVPVTVLPALAGGPRQRLPSASCRPREPAVVVPEASVLRVSRQDRRQLMEQVDAAPRSLLLGHRLDVEV